MASRRKLKKAVDRIADSLYTEVLYSSLVSSTDPEIWMALINRIIIFRQDFISRISHVEPGCKPNAFFRNLITSLGDKVNVLVADVQKAQKAN